MKSLTVEKQKKLETKKKKTEKLKKVDSINQNIISNVK